MPASVRLPAEWEPHRATLLAWPHNPRDWPGKFQAIPWVFAEIARLLAGGEPVIIAVQDSAHETRARSALERTGVDMASVSFHRAPLNRGWLRDCAPFFVKRGDAVEARAFRFNAWARYDDWEHDAAFTEAVAAKLGIPCSQPEHLGVTPVLEGGGVDSNGAGTVLVTEEWLLDPDDQVRNAGWTAADYEALFKRHLGAPRTVWLGRGIAGDDTHGHVDDLCRFVNANTVVIVQEDNPADINHAPLRENWERLQNVRLADGAKLEAVPLPMPAPRVFDGERLPASYANFYIGNETVIVPTFNDPKDREVLGILAELFPDRRVAGLHAVDLIWGFGAVHCLTHEVPA